MGKKTTNFSTGELAHHIGFLFQRPEQQLFAPTVRDEVAFGPAIWGWMMQKTWLTSALERFNLTGVADLPPAILSYGIQRAVTLACLAAMHSSIIVLDEPTVGLDGRGWQQLISWLAELRDTDTTIIAVTHEMSLASQADRVLVLEKGVIIADGLPGTVLRTSHSREGWMSFIFDTYVPGTLISAQDWIPGSNYWARLLSLILVFWIPGLVLQGLLLASFHLVLLLAGVPGRRLFSIWRQMAVLLILIMVLQPLFHPDGYELFALGPLRLTTGGITDALRLATRALGFAFAISILLITTENNILVLAFGRLGLPYTWGLTISLALRFLPAIQSMFHAIKDAQASRGWVARGGLFKRLREYLPVLIAVIVGTLRMSDQLTLALAARGLETSSERTRWHDIQMHPSDWIWTFFLTLGFIAFVWWRTVVV